ncbi:UPF0561 protein C2orf68 homolog [Sycon ciliatum]|uniref:UPF0561 protein C2orf68 homolog n=1 Tax=Sycon ciliatum TaxID=27933 RepID=UPI0020AB443F|eukprot:scpid86955/ scgid24895/ 
MSEPVIIDDDNEETIVSSPAAEDDEEERKAPRVDMKHGFVRTIQKNQQARVLCDRDEEAMKMAIRFGRSFKTNPKSGGAVAKRPERQLYTPKRRRTAPDTDETGTPAAASATSGGDHRTKDSPVLLQMDVEVAPDDWKSLTVRKADTAQSLARQVALENSLEPRMAAALAYHIAVNINKLTDSV